MYRSEEKKISMRRLNIFIGLSTYIAHCQANNIRNNTFRDIDSYNQTDVFWIITNFMFLQEGHKDTESSPPPPMSYFLPIPHQFPIITIDVLRTKSKLSCEAELCFSILSQDRLSESSHHLYWPGILPVAHPTSTPHTFLLDKAQCAWFHYPPPSSFIFPSLFTLGPCCLLIKW